METETFYLVDGMPHSDRRYIQRQMTELQYNHWRAQGPDVVVYRVVVTLPARAGHCDVTVSSLATEVKEAKDL
mgnify:FL=1